MKIVFWGTPEIAIPSLKFFIEKEDIEVVGVVTQPDRPSGRGHKLVSSPVKILAEQAGVEIFQPRLVRKDVDVITRLKELSPDACVTVAFGQILSEEILNIPRLGTINLHASLLPKYRGPNPIQWAVINGDKVAGVTTMLSDVGVDTGPMLLKKEFNIENIDSLQLSEQIASSGPDMLYHSLIGLENKTLTPVVQDDSCASKAPKLKKEDGNINWNDSALIIHNKIRGMKPWPSSYTTFKGNVVKIIESVVCNESNAQKYQPGSIISLDKKGVRVATADGIIILTMLQPAGKKQVDAKSWYNGARIQPEDSFSS